LKTVDFSNHTLVLPLLSIGNVGQLVADLLIFNGKFEKVGYLDSPYVFPVVGNDSFTTNGGILTTNLEVFKHPDRPITIIQQRAPVIKKHNLDFVQSLVAWIKECKFKEVVILGSIDASRRIDIQMTSSPLRYVSSLSISTSSEDYFKSLGWISLESESHEFLFRKGTIVKFLFEECKTNGVPTLILTIFCGEGNNLPESVQTASFANLYLKLLSDPQWSLPLSWRSIEGNQLDYDSYTDLF